MPSQAIYEVTVAYGLEKVAAQEVRSRLGKQLRFNRHPDEEAGSGALQFRLPGDPNRTSQRLLSLNTIQNVFLVCQFGVTRPNALLDGRNLAIIEQHIKTAMRLSPRGRYTTFGISAAGSESNVMQRLRNQLGQQLGLCYEADDVDLALRIRPIRLPHKAMETGWEVLIRLTPRPLSARAWRVSDMKGALNAPVAHCMVRLTRPQPKDKFLNLACGSGTLLIERVIATHANRVIGCDINPDALEHARQNLAASQLSNIIELHNWDARSLNLPDASIDALCSDLPFGIAIGSHEDNVSLYPDLLTEAARVAKPNARFVLITQEINLIQEAIENSEAWKLMEELKVNLRGLNPRIFVLERNRLR
ncbi:MAG: methyltransferase domain-containing protein [Chloroflexota bacterium]